MKAFAGKILIIVQNLPVPFDRRVWLEAKTLTEHGYKVSVISPKSKEFDKSHEVIENISVYRYKMPVDAEGVLSYFFEFAYAWLATAILSLKVLFKDGFDAIHACNPPDTFFLLGMIYKLFGKKYIFDHHDLCPEMFLAKYEKTNTFLHRFLLFLEKMTFRTADVVISTNESYKRTAIKRGRKKTEDVFVVRTGPDLKRLKPLPKQDYLKGTHNHMVCYLGEMCPQDGIDYLLKSAQYMINDMGRRDVLFMLIGGGPAMPKFRAMSKKMGLEDSVKFTGRIPDDLLCQYLSTADVCVDPDPWSEWADHSTMNKILEYMTFAKPIVAFELQEAKCSAQKAAAFVEPNNIIKFSEKISDLLDDPQKRTRMGQFGQQRIRNELAWSHTRKNLILAYEKIFTPAVNNAPQTVADVLRKKKVTVKRPAFSTVPAGYKHNKKTEMWPSIEKVGTYELDEKAVAA